MPVKIVDASALGALVFGESEAEAVSESLSNHVIAAPFLLWFELASICLKKIKKAPADKATFLKAYKMSQRLAIEMVEVDYLDVIRMAEEKNITTYDASYLWIAQKLDGQLVTLDRQLGEASMADG